ncbi:4a-hydroxytetrahydrobiopterin dehydratase [Mesorhizobium sp. WSM2561]|uniref:4a-hydroxytetrahydrobiopterin dehydratase n=1 Tax=Mesorhizobium sp. WSM2561 TaxID=1040985 RepID=UPI001FDA5382|nr:4a-hydroxytetrahydrobiopterin dehydratase [Mesorhizobium sp. WSM2561]
MCNKGDRHGREHCPENLYALPRRHTAADREGSRRISFPDARLGSSGGGTPDTPQFKFADFREALTFVDEVGRLAEEEGHHPDICFGWGYAEISLQTHKIRGLHENDFIMAAKINQLAGL